MTSEKSLKNTNSNGNSKDTVDTRDKIIQFTDNGNNVTDIYLQNPNNNMPVYNQGMLGSCCANAIAFLYVITSIKQNVTCPFLPSRLFLYYNTRKSYGKINIDTGASIRNTYKAINTDGVCPEKLWQYNCKKFNTLPTIDCYNLAASSKNVSYGRIKLSYPDDTSKIEQLENAIKNGYPFVFGIATYDNNLLINKNNVLQDPSNNKTGSHAVCCVGFDREKRLFKIRNSWGVKWGESGHFYMSYESILSDRCHDFWVLESVANIDGTIQGIYDKSFLAEYIVNLLPPSSASTTKFEDIPTIELVTTLDRYNIITSSNRKVIANFCTPVCGACLQSEPIFKQLSTQYTDIKFIRIIADNPDFSNFVLDKSIRSFPTFYYIHNNNVIDIQKGANAYLSATKTKGLNSLIN